jgi:hypothetical protein
MPEMASKPGEPTYKVLFESGYYSDAVKYCTAMISGPPFASNREIHLYLAYSYIMLGNRESADSIFIAIFDADSGFYLNPIVTSPKIYEVYFTARTKWEMLNSSGDTESEQSLPEQSSPKTGEISVPDSGLQTPGNNIVRKQPSSPFPLLMCIPGGAGQFFNRQHAKGVVVLLFQAAAIAGSVAAYYKRDGFYSPEYGWTDENIDRARLYTYGYKGGLIVFSTVWVYGIADGFVIRHRRNTKQTGN